MPLIDEHGAIRGPDPRPWGSRFRGLREDATLHDGPPLSGYYTSYLALDVEGTAVFWRDSTLITVDAGFRRRDLVTRPDARTVMSRVLLLDDGQVALALADELLIFRGTGLGPLAAGPWPCGDGGLAGNPAARR